MDIKFWKIGDGLDWRLVVPDVISVHFASDASRGIDFLGARHRQPYDGTVIVFERDRVVVSEGMNGTTVAIR